MTPRQQERALERRRAGIAVDREMERRYPHLGAWHEAEPSPEALLLERIARTLESLGAPGSHPAPKEWERTGSKEARALNQSPMRENLKAEVSSPSRPLPALPATKAQMERLMELRQAAGITDAADLPRFLTTGQIAEAIASLEAAMIAP